MDKKGQGISMTYIIIALLALVVLVVIILFFTGGMQKIFGQTVETGEITEQQLSIWRKQCELYCSIDETSFCEHKFEVKDKEGKVTKSYICNTEKTSASGIEKIENLNVKCPDIASCTG